MSRLRSTSDVATVIQLAASSKSAQSNGADLPAVDVRVRLRPLVLHQRLRLLKLHPLQQGRTRTSAAADLAS